MRDDSTVVALITRARDGDKHAWDEIVERYAPLVWSTCRRHRLSRADTDDVAQIVWLRLLEHLPQLREPAALPGWLATTTQRECWQVVRKAEQQKRLEHSVEPGIIADEESAPVEREVLAEEWNVALREAFAQLPARCHHLLSLLMGEPPTPYVEISEKLGIAVGSIGPIRARCLEKLRRSPALAALIDAELESARGGGTRDRPVVE